MSHFKKYWDENLQKLVLEDAERIVSLIKGVSGCVTQLTII
jgi:hypothetical protein